MHYYKLNIADWNLGTAHLTLEEEAIYFRLVNYYYDTELPLINDVRQLARKLRVSNYIEILTELLNEFFELTENGWIHSRIDTEISDYHAKSETSKINGSKGGRPKKPKKTQQVNLANPDETQTKANHKPLTINQLKEKEKKKTKVFTRPSVDEVQQYIFEKKYTIDPQRFIDHYNSNGWKVGRNAMKDWKAAVRTWQGREANRNETGSNIVKHPARQSGMLGINDTSW